MSTTTGMKPVMLERKALRAWAKQPRKKFGEAKMQELAESLRAIGQLQALVVRPVAKDDAEAEAAGVTHEIIVGERRWRASERAGLGELLCTVRALTDKEAAAVALMENTHRDDLDVEEEASGFRMMQTEGWEIVEIADMTGKKPDYIYEMLDLLKLDRATLKELSDGTITRATARTLGRIENREARSHARERVVNKGGAPMAQRAALEVIKADYLAKQKLQEKWEGKEKKLRAAYPGAEIVGVEQAHEYLGRESRWVRATEKPADYLLAVHMRSEDSQIPTWLELAEKHGAKQVVVPDDKGDPVLMADPGPLEAAERTAGEKDPLACIFAIAGGRGRHEQSVEAKQQQAAANKNYEEQRRQEADRRGKLLEARKTRQGNLLRHLQADLLRGPGDTWSRFREVLKVVWEHDHFANYSSTLELLGVDAPALADGDREEGGLLWLEQRVEERAGMYDGDSGEDVLLFLVLSYAIGAIAIYGTGESFEEEMRKLEAACGYVPEETAA